MQRRTVLTAAATGLVSNSLLARTNLASQEPLFGSMMGDILGRQSEVEMIFSTTKPLFVDLSRLDVYGNRVTFNLHRKAATLRKHHELKFALLQHNHNSDWTTSLNVSLDNNGTKVLLGTSGPTGGTNCSKSRDGNHIYFVFFNPGTSDVICTVIFRLLPTSEEETVTLRPAIGLYLKIIDSTATTQNLDSTGAARPDYLLDASTINSDLHAYAVKHASGKDTLVLPSIVNGGHWVLCPTLAAASVDEKPYVGRRLARHAVHLVGAVSAYQGTVTVDSYNALHKSVGNELATVFGGQTMVDKMQSVRATVMANLGTLEAKATSLLQTALAELKSMTTSDLVTGTRALAESTAQSNPLYGVGGVSASTNLQGIFKVGSEVGLFGELACSNAGIRFSLQLARATHSWVFGGASPLADYYSILNAGSQGGKFAYTVIINILPDFDMELTMGTTILDGKCRIDYFQMDPVVDVLNENYIQKISTALYNRIVVPVGSSVARVSLPRFFTNNPVANFLGGRFAAAVSSASTMFSGFQMPGFASTVNTRISACISKIAPTASKSIGTLELSLLRFIWVNSDINNPLITSFRGGYNNAGMHWIPGVKYISGWGAEWKFTNGPYYMSMVLRVVTTTDAFVTGGSKEIVRYISKFTDN